MGRLIGKYDPTLKKVVWKDEDDWAAESILHGEGPAVWDDIEYEGIGFPGAPRVTSRSMHRELLKRHGMIEVGNEQPARLREHREKMRDRRT